MTFLLKSYHRNLVVKLLFQNVKYFHIFHNLIVLRQREILNTALALIMTGSAPNAPTVITGTIWGYCRLY